MVRLVDKRLAPSGQGTKNRALREKKNAGPPYDYDAEWRRVHLLNLQEKVRLENLARKIKIPIPEALPADYESSNKPKWYTTDTEYGSIGAAFSKSVDRPSNPNRITDTSGYTLNIPTAISRTQPGPPTIGGSFRRNFDMLQVEKEIAEFARLYPDKVKIPAPKNEKTVEVKTTDVGTEGQAPPKFKPPRKPHWEYLFPGNVSGDPTKDRVTLATKPEQGKVFDNVPDEFMAPSAQAAFKALREKGLKTVKYFLAGDQIPRTGGGIYVGSDPATENTEYRISYAEYVRQFLLDMGIPDLLKQPLLGQASKNPTPWGVARRGRLRSRNMLNMHLNMTAFRLASRGGRQAAFEQASAEIARLENAGASEADLARARGKLKEIGRHRRVSPFFYSGNETFISSAPSQQNNFPVVMFCLMDPAPSMDDQMKAMARRFYSLSYIFLKHRYSHVDVVFVRHAEQKINPREADQENVLFNSNVPRTTVVSAGLEVVRELTAKKYHPSQWKIVVAQVSSGQVPLEDKDRCLKILSAGPDPLLPKLEFFGYCQVSQKSRRDEWAKHANNANIYSKPEATPLDLGYATYETRPNFDRRDVNNETDIAHVLIKLTGVNPVGPTVG